MVLRIGFTQNLDNDVTIKPKHCMIFNQLIHIVTFSEAR